MIAPEDYRTISYFWHQKGDFTRYARWKEIENEFRQKHPQFFLAYDQMILAQKTFNFVVDEICDAGGEEDE